MYKDFREMPVWQDAMQVATMIFELTEKLPKKEDYGFTSQIRRSALSISANIAEAFGRNHTADKINFYYYVRGSITETLSHCEYGKQVKYINAEQRNLLDDKLSTLLKSINQIIVTLRNKSKPNS